MDTDALLERYRKEIEDLKRRLAQRELDSPVKTRRLSAREVSAMIAIGPHILALTLGFSKWMRPRR